MGKSLRHSVQRIHGKASNSTTSRDYGVHGKLGMSCPSESDATSIADGNVAWHCSSNCRVTASTFQLTVPATWSEMGAVSLYLFAQTISLGGNDILINLPAHAPSIDVSAPQYTRRLLSGASNQHDIWLCELCAGVIRVSYGTSPVNPNQNPIRGCGISGDASWIWRISSSEGLNFRASGIVLTCSTVWTPTTGKT